VDVFQTQRHTPYPTGSYELVYENLTIDNQEFPSLRTPIPWDASGDIVETAIESMFPDDLVNVQLLFLLLLLTFLTCLYLRWKSHEQAGV
jgi:hypothetical protein